MSVIGSRRLRRYMNLKLSTHELEELLTKRDLTLKEERRLVKTQSKSSKQVKRDKIGCWLEERQKINVANTASVETSDRRFVSDADTASAETSDRCFVSDLEESANQGLLEYIFGKSTELEIGELPYQMTRDLLKWNAVVGEVRGKLKQGRGNVKESWNKDNWKFDIRQDYITMAIYSIAKKLESNAQFRPYSQWREMEWGYHIGIGAALAEEFEIGNCDHCGRLALVHMAKKMEQGDVISLMTAPGHCFAKVITAAGSHIIIDPWGYGPAIFDEDAYFSTFSGYGAHSNLETDSVRAIATYTYETASLISKCYNEAKILLVSEQSKIRNDVLELARRTRDLYEERREEINKYYWAPTPVLSPIGYSHYDRIYKKTKPYEIGQKYLINNTQNVHGIINQLKNVMPMASYNSIQDFMKRIRIDQNESISDRGSISKQLANWYEENYIKFDKIETIKVIDNILEREEKRKIEKNPKSYYDYNDPYYWEEKNKNKLFLALRFVNLSNISNIYNLNKLTSGRAWAQYHEMTNVSKFNKNLLVMDISRALDNLLGISVANPRAQAKLAVALSGKMPGMTKSEVSWLLDNQRWERGEEWVEYYRDNYIHESSSYSTAEYLNNMTKEIDELIYNLTSHVPEFSHIRRYSILKNLSDSSRYEFRPKLKAILEVEKRAAVNWPILDSERW